MSGTKIRIRFIGWFPFPGVSETEYRDWVDHMRTMWRKEFEINLETGNFPPGLCVLPDGGIVGVILGRGEDQYIAPAKGAMRT